MNKKAVLISCFNYYENRIRLVEEFLQEQGYACTYITSDFDHIKKESFCLQQKNTVQIPTRPYRRNLSAERLLSHHFFAKAAFEQVEKSQPDFLFVMVPPNSMAEFAAKYKISHPVVKLVLDLYDLWPETFPDGRAKKILAAPFALWRRTRDRGLDSADLITTECRLYQEVLRDRLADRPASVLYLCRPGETCQQPLTAPVSEELNLCYLGSINNIIDIPAIAGLLGEIAKLRPVVLHVIGDGESRVQFIEAVQAAGAKVIFHGIVYDSAQKQKIFDQCSFGINMMKSSVCVGLTMKSLDYFAGGLPILNSIGGDTHELVEKRKIGWNVCRSDLYQTAVLAAQASPEENLRMRENTLRMFRELFSEEAFRKQLQQSIGHTV